MIIIISAFFLTQQLQEQKLGGIIKHLKIDLLTRVSEIIKAFLQLPSEEKCYENITQHMVIFECMFANIK
jgi:hypothetical protein